MTLITLNQIVLAAEDRESQEKIDVPVMEYREVAARSVFYGTSFGTLSYLPKANTHEAALDAGLYRILPKRSLCRLNAKNDNLWFQFNHRSNEGNGKPRHLGVIIVTETTGVEVVRSEFARNKGWVRSGNNGATLEELSRPSDKSWDEFDAFMQKSHTVEDTDAIIGGTWHGTPVNGENPSFTYEKFWVSYFNIYKKTAPLITPQTSEQGLYRVSARLMAYAMTQKGDSDRPVVFNVTAHGGDRIYMGLYTLLDGGVDISDWYWIEVGAKP